jgi:hypothetical protein
MARVMFRLDSLSPDGPPSRKLWQRHCTTLSIARVLIEHLAACAETTER